MKRILYTVLLFAATISLHAQIDRSVQPKAGPATEPTIAEYKEYTLRNDIQLIVVENHKLPRVSISLMLDVDPILEGDKAGYVSLAGELLGEGTTNRTKLELDEEVDFMGASLSTSSRGVYVSGLSKYSEKLMEIMSDVVLNPAFPEESFEKLREQMISGLRSEADNAGAIAGNTYQAQIYGLDHAYGEMVNEETVNNVTLDDCRNYYNTYFRPNVTYIAVVGDIKPREAKKLVERYFKEWEEADVPEHPVSVPELPEATYIALVDRAVSVQSEIRIGNRIEMPLGHPDLEALRVANQILGGGSMARLFTNLREDKAYTYGAYSSFGTDEVVSTFTANAAVRNEVTDSAVAEFLHEINRMRTELVSDEELEAAKNNLIGGFGRSLESAQTVARFGLNIKVYGLDEDYYNGYTSRLEAVTAEDIRAAAQKYMTAENLSIVVVGKAADIAEGLEQFGEVRRFDRFGQPASASASVPVGLTADKVLENYLTAIGGREQLEAVESYHASMSASIQGMSITLTEKWLAPDKFYNAQQSPMGAQEIIINGDKGVTRMGGQTVPMSEEELEAAREEAVLFEELDGFNNADLNLLPEVADVDGVEAYAVEVTDGDETTTYYYSTETGLRIRSSQVMDSPNGEVVMNVDYSDYQEVNGIKTPYTLRVPLGPGMSADFKATVVEFNGDIDTGDFEI